MSKIEKEKINFDKNAYEFFIKPIPKRTRAPKSQKKNSLRTGLGSTCFVQD